MISKNDQTRCLESLLNSQEFSGSKIYNSYLNYLVEAKNAGKELKETTIAFEFFGKDASFNPSEDTIVRSHTYQLRKKLESYYHEEGKDDKCRLVIPKGHYDVKFVHVSDEVATSKVVPESFAEKEAQSLHHFDSTSRCDLFGFAQFFSRKAALAISSD